MSSRPVLCSLASAPVDLAGLRNLARKDLLHALATQPGKKILYLDDALTGIVSLTLEVADLRSHGVTSWGKLDNPDVFKFDDVASPAVFLIRAFGARAVLQAARVAAHLADDAKKGITRPYLLLVAPSMSFAVRDKLRELRCDVRIECLPNFHTCILEGDLISAEIPGLFRDFHAFGSLAGLGNLSKILIHWQKSFGKFRKIYSVGSAAKSLADMVLAAAAEESSEQATPAPGELRVPLVQSGVSGQHELLGRVDAAVFIDRRVDLASLFCTEVNYEALLDRVLGIKNGFIEIPNGDGKTQLALNSDDPIFKEMRDLPSSQLGSWLKRKASEIQETYKEKDSLQNIPEIHEYMTKFKTTQHEHSSLTAHVNLASTLSAAATSQDWFAAQLRLEDEIISGAKSGSEGVAAIEALIDHGEPMARIMRLMCLLSISSGGIKSKALESLMKTCIEAFGIEMLPLLENLQVTGALKAAKNLNPAGGSKWSKVKEAFKLVPADQENNDLGSAFSGYVPLTVRLVELLCGKGWRSATDALNLLWGPALEVSQTTTETLRLGNPTQVTLLVFVGGVSYGEVSAIRALERLQGAKQRFIIMTTEMLNHSKLFDSLARLI